MALEVVVLGPISMLKREQEQQLVPQIIIISNSSSSIMANRAGKIRRRQTVDGLRSGEKSKYGLMDKMLRVPLPPLPEPPPPPGFNR